jgi:hypothetical protein
MGCAAWSVGLVFGLEGLETNRTRVCLIVMSVDSVDSCRQLYARRGIQETLQYALSKHIIYIPHSLILVLCTPSTLLLNEVHSSSKVQLPSPTIHTGWHSEQNNHQRIAVRICARLLPRHTPTSSAKQANTLSVRLASSVSSGRVNWHVVVISHLRSTQHERLVRH